MPPSPDSDVWRYTEADRRKTICEAATAFMATGLSQRQAARALGEDAASLSRYLRAYKEGGYPALLPGVSSGRKTERAKLIEALSPEAVQQIEQKVMGEALDMDGSDGAAWRTVARRADAPEPVREYFKKVEDVHASKHSIARSLRRATRVTPSMRLAHRGPRALSLLGAWTPRHCDILPGDIFSSDDTTPIFGYFIPVERCQKYPTGYKTMQGQFLPMIDVRSQAVISFAFVGRETGSYRASDIWRLIGFSHRAVGVPRLGYQKERGSWEAGLIDGVEVMVGDGDFSHARRVGGLRMLPSTMLPYHVERMNGASFPSLQTFTSFLPKSKSVEGVLHRLQKFEGTLWGSLGRDQMRKPFERAKKIFEACKRGAASAPLHFLSLDEITRRYLALLEDYHAEPVQGEVFRGRPLEVFQAGITEHGPRATPPVEVGHLYRSDWACVTVARSLVRIRRQNHELGRSVSYFYQNPELFARPDVDGKRVLVYFDRDAFESPADVVSLEGEWLGQAHYFQRVGMFLDGDLSGHEERRASRDAVTAIYQSVLPHIPSRQLPAEIAARRQKLKGVDDGRDRVVWATVGGDNFPSPAQGATDSRDSRGSTGAGDGNLLPDRAARRSVVPATPEIDLDVLAAKERAAKETMGIYD